MEIDFTPVFAQLARNHGATIALAKLTLPEEQFNLFLLEADIQSQHSLLEFLELNPNIFDDVENSKNIINKNIDELKKQREELNK